MPTPTAAFADVAAKYGDIDPEDIEAVQAWFVEELPKLSPEVIERALHELLAEDGAVPSRHVTPVYPERVRLPSLLASPHVDAPLLAEPWSRLLRSVARRLKKPR